MDLGRRIRGYRHTRCIWRWGRDDKERQAAYRALFRAQLDRAAIDDIRLALNQSQPLGNARFYARIEQVTGLKRVAKPRGRPRVKSRPDGAALPETE